MTGGTFATPISTQNVAVSFPLAPSITAPAGTKLVKAAIGYALNSVKFDPKTAGTGTSAATSVQPGAGCVAAMGKDPLVIEAVGGAFKFGVDENNAHV